MFTMKTWNLQTIDRPPIHRSKSQVRSLFACHRTLTLIVGFTRECGHLAIRIKLISAVSTMHHNTMQLSSGVNSKSTFANTKLHPALATGQNCCSTQPQDERMARQGAVSPQQLKERPSKYLRATFKRPSILSTTTECIDAMSGCDTGKAPLS